MKTLKTRSTVSLPKTGLLRTKMVLVTVVTVASVTGRVCIV